MNEILQKRIEEAAREYLDYTLTLWNWGTFIGFENN